MYKKLSQPEKTEKQTYKMNEISEYSEISKGKYDSVDR